MDTYAKQREKLLGQSPSSAATAPLPNRTREVALGPGATMLDLTGNAKNTLVLRTPNGRISTFVVMPMVRIGFFMGDEVHFILNGYLYVLKARPTFVDTAPGKWTVMTGNVTDKDALEHGTRYTLEEYKRTYKQFIV